MSCIRIRKKKKNTHTRGFHGAYTRVSAIFVARASSPARGSIPSTCVSQFTSSIRFSVGPCSRFSFMREVGPPRFAFATGQIRRASLSLASLCLLARVTERRNETRGFHGGVRYPFDKEHFSRLPPWLFSRQSSRYATLLRVSYCVRASAARKGERRLMTVSERWMARMRQCDGPIDFSKLSPIPPLMGDSRAFVILCRQRPMPNFSATSVLTFN